MTSDARKGRLGLRGGDGPTEQAPDLAVLDPGLDMRLRGTTHVGEKTGVRQVG